VGGLNETLKKEGLSKSLVQRKKGLTPLPTAAAEIVEQEDLGEPISRASDGSACVPGPISADPLGSPCGPTVLSMHDSEQEPSKGAPKRKRQKPNVIDDLFNAL
jgi:hypothetical protein